VVAMKKQVMVTGSDVEVAMAVEGEVVAVKEK